MRRDKRKAESDIKQGKIDEAADERLKKAKVGLEERGLFPCGHLLLPYHETRKNYSNMCCFLSLFVVI